MAGVAAQCTVVRQDLHVTFWQPAHQLAQVTRMVLFWSGDLEKVLSQSPADSQI